MKLDSVEHHDEYVPDLKQFVSMQVDQARLDQFPKYQARKLPRNSAHHPAKTLWFATKGYHFAKLETPESSPQSDSSA